MYHANLNYLKAFNMKYNDTGIEFVDMKNRSPVIGSTVGCAEIKNENYFVRINSIMKKKLGSVCSMMRICVFQEIFLYINNA